MKEGKVAFKFEITTEKEKNKRKKLLRTENWDRENDFLMKCFNEEKNKWKFLEYKIIKNRIMKLTFENQTGE